MPQTDSSGEYEMMLTNPPFGKKSSVTIVNEAGDEEKQSLVIHRDDFWASTSNEQLNFLQLATGRVRPSADTSSPS